jgi:hypothetical protein
MANRLTWNGLNRGGTFGDGRKKLLVDFRGPKNEPVGDWCPKWAEVQELVLGAIDTETGNGGDYVEMLTAVEKRLSRHMPQLAIRRQDALIVEFRPPIVDLECLDGNQRTWRERPSLKLGCPIPQGVLDLLVENAIEVVAIIRADVLQDVRVTVRRRHGREECSAASLTAARLKVVPLGNSAVHLVEESEH